MSGWAIEVRVPPGSRAATAARLVEWTELAVEERADGTPNILQTVNSALLPTIRQALRPAGRAIFAGMEQEEAEEFLTMLNQEAFDPIDEECDAGWWAVAAHCR
ncbi:MAG: hypothetical protein HKM89_11875 [Gemmatimonadales bacterium]|nr:hypothetical protein [Gemmatimonadales bacterium]